MSGTACAPSPRPMRIIHPSLNCGGICRHSVEVMITPGEATVYFHDERWIDPVDTQIRFEALVLNSDTGVTWQVLAPDGTPGAGTIDATGLYQAPDKGALATFTTELVLASARADPLRKAYAFVTLLGEGPLPAPAPAIEIWPKTRTLTYPGGADNAYIDDRNKMQLFQAFPKNSPGPGVTWLVDGVVQPGNDVWFLYRPPATGSDALHSVTAQIPGLPQVADTALVSLVNYLWPGL